MSDKKPSAEELEKQIADLTKERDAALEREKEADEHKGILQKLGRLLTGKSDEGSVDTGNDVVDAELTKTRAELDSQRDELKKAQDKIEKLEAQREKDQMIALAKSLPGNPDDTASELVKIKTSLGAEEFEAYVKRQKAVAEQLRVNKLLTQFGSDADNDSGLEGVEAQIDKEIQAVMSKSAELTKEQAEARFYETTKGQELWARYQEALEQRQREVS